MFRPENTPSAVWSSSGYGMSSFDNRIAGNYQDDSFATYHGYTEEDLARDEQFVEAVLYPCDEDDVSGVGR
jgi:hypothetical protein